MDCIRVTNLIKRFGKTAALRDITLDVRKGEFSVLLGPSGCGKTTLLRIVAGLERADAGKVILAEQDVTFLPPRRRNIAMVFQNYAIFPHMKVYDNIAFGLRMKKFSKDETHRRVEEAMELMHISPLSKRLSSQLSGGQRQRVAVARALAMKPEVLLMDEPLSNLDALLRLEMRAELKNLLHAAGTTTLYVTHDQTEAMSLADRIAVMYNGQLIQYAPVQDIYGKPATTFVGGFIGNPPMNIISIRNLRQEEQQTKQAIQKLKPPSRVPFEELSVGLRAEDVQVVKSDATKSTPNGGWPIKVLVVEPLGAQLHISARIGDGLFRAVAPPDADINEGDTVFLHPQNPHWFDAEGQALSSH